MRAVVSFFVKYPIWANAIIAICILGGGTTYLFNLKKSFFPEREPRGVTITMAYPGASPEEVEEGITLKVEEAVKGIEGIEEVTSVSSENSASIQVRTKIGYDLDEVTTEVKNAVDRINSFPVSAENAIVFKQKSTTTASFLSIRGNVSLFALKKAAEQVEDDFLKSGVISQVRLSGFPDVEISIEAKENDLRRYGLTFDQVSSAIRLNNRDISGGTIKTVEEEIRIRANAKEFDPSVLEEIIVRANPDGTKLKLGQIAVVTFQFADVPNKFFWNGQRAVNVTVSKLPEEDIEEISAFVEKYTNEFNEKNSNIELLTDFDFNSILSDRLDLLLKNFGTGLLLVLFTLGFFLSLRLSVWVALGIPISFFGMFIIGDMANITINILSLTGMLLVVGILVDDGIVIAENIYTHFQKGKDPHQAAVDGTMEMIPSVFTSVSTTMVAFLPLIFLDNNGFTKEIAIVVIACLAISLLEAFFVLPAHLAHRWVLSRRKSGGWYSRFRSGMERIIDHVRYKMYGPFVMRLLKHRWVAVTAPIVFMILVGGMFSGGILEFSPFSRPPVDNISIDLVLKPGTRENITQDYLEGFVSTVWDFHNKLLNEGTIKDSIITNVDLTVGVSSDRATNGSNAGNVEVEFDNLDENNLSGLQLGGMIRKELGNIPEAEKFTVGSANYWGKPISISLKSKNIEDLEKARLDLKESLRSLPDLRDVTDNAAIGQRELSLTLKPLAYHLGLTHQDITTQIRQGFFGEEVQRLQIGTDEVRIWVRYPKEDRLSVAQLESMKVKRPNGIEYPLSELANYSIKRGIININHFNGKREIRVSAELTSVKTPLPPLIEKISRDLLPPLLAKYPSMEYTFEGQSRGGARLMSSFVGSLGPILLIMLLLITLNFRSFYQTLVILLLIPLGWACACFGHIFHDFNVSFTSIYGMLALSGVIVNDAVVMLDKYNRNLKEGMTVIEAANTAGTARFRAIILTSLTTVAGLFPLIFETSFQAQFIIPMAISLAYGVLFGTMFILFFFPPMILVFNDIKVYISWMFKAIFNGIKSVFLDEEFDTSKPSKEEVEPAIMEHKKLANF